MGSLVAVNGYGKLSKAPDANAGVLVVFGGIPVEFGGKMVQSGIYMWNYMNKVKDRYHIFVAESPEVNGERAYRALMDTFKSPPSDPILYLFSGGYLPGMSLLRGAGAKRFSLIYLVDIWMGVTKKSGSVVPDFYKKIVDENASKITYVYTEKAAANTEARDYIANNAKAIRVEGSHMSTNTTAVALLP